MTSISLLWRIGSILSDEIKEILLGALSSDVALALPLDSLSISPSVRL